MAYLADARWAKIDRKARARRGLTELHFQTELEFDAAEAGFARCQKWGVHDPADQVVIRSGSPGEELGTELEHDAFHWMEGFCERSVQVAQTRPNPNGLQTTMIS
jgi:hypothetical protein